jgi:hypothetical protein
MITERQLDVLIGSTAVGPTARSAPSATVYVDDRTHRPEWAAVRIGLLGTREALVPLTAAEVSGDDLSGPYDEDTVANAPRINAEGHLSPSDEAERYRYHGLGGGYDSAAPVTDTTRGAGGDDASGSTTDAARMRFEKHLRVGTPPVESGPARRRTYVVTENVTRTVPVSHEAIRLEREPITDANAGGAGDGSSISEEKFEVVLHTERPVGDVTERRTMTEQVCTNG